MLKINYKTIFLSIASVLIITACAQQNNSDNMLVVEGERTFIIGSYHLPRSETPFKELSENGFNYVRVSPRKEALDKADYIVFNTSTLKELENSFKELLEIIQVQIE